MSVPPKAPDFDTGWVSAAGVEELALGLDELLLAFSFETTTPAAIAAAATIKMLGAKTKIHCRQVKPQCFFFACNKGFASSLISELDEASMPVETSFGAPVPLLVGGVVGGIGGSDASSALRVLAVLLRDCRLLAYDGGRII